MAWTSPPTRSTGYVILASDWNSNIVNNLLYLHGDAGNVDFGPGGNNFNFASLTTQNMQVTASGAGNQAVGAYVTGDTQPRAQHTAGGTYSWGPGGSTAVDTTLARAGVGVLQAGNQIVGLATNVSQAGGTTWTPTWNNAAVQRLNVTSTGLITLASPGTPANTLGAILILIVHNASGGTITFSFNAIYASTVAAPGNGIGTVMMWVWNAGTSKWSLALTAAE